MGYFYSLPPVYVGGAQPYAPSLGQSQSGPNPPPTVPPFDVSRYNLSTVRIWWDDDPPIVITLPSAAGNIAPGASQVIPPSSALLMSIIRQWDQPFFYAPPVRGLAPLILPPVAPTPPPPLSYSNLYSVIRQWDQAPYYGPNLQRAPPLPQSGPNFAVFLVQPSNAIVFACGSTIFSVVVVSLTSVTYQWFQNGIAIPGATGSSYTVLDAPLTQNASQFQVAVTNASGTVFSNVAVLLVVSAFGPTSGGQILTPNPNILAPAGAGGDIWGARGGGVTPIGGGLCGQTGYDRPIAVTVSDGERAANYIVAPAPTGTVKGKESDTSLPGSTPDSSLPAGNSNAG